MPVIPALWEALGSLRPAWPIRENLPLKIQKLAGLGGTRLQSELLGRLGD